VTELIVPASVVTADVEGYCDVATGECVVPEQPEDPSGRE
jgi:hypothetical protein